MRLIRIETPVRFTCSRCLAHGQTSGTRDLDTHEMLSGLGLNDDRYCELCSTKMSGWMVRPAPAGAR